MKILKKLLYCLVTLFFIFIFNNEVKGARVCSYELNLPEIMVAAHYYSEKSGAMKEAEAKKKLQQIEEVCKSGNYEKGKLLDKVCKDGKIVAIATKIYIYGRLSYLEVGKDSDIKEYMLERDAGALYYLSAGTVNDITKYNSMTIKSINGTSKTYDTARFIGGMSVEEMQNHQEYNNNATSYLNADIFNNAPIVENLDGWLAEFNGSNCPEIHVYYGIGDTGGTHSIQLYGREYQNLVGEVIEDGIYHKVIPATSGDTWAWETGETKQTNVKCESEREYSSCNYDLIGTGILQGKEIPLKANIVYGKCKEVDTGTEKIQRDYWKVTFFDGTNKKEYFDIYEDDLEFYDLGFDVQGLGSKPKMFISEDVDQNGGQAETFFHPTSCLQGGYLYVFPYTYENLLTGSKTSVYKVTAHEYEYKDYVDPYKKPIYEFDFNSEDGILKTFRMIGFVIIIIKVLVPVLLIIFGAIDFGKASTDGDEKKIQKATKNLVMRAVAGVAIFFIPTIVNFVINLVSEWTTVDTKFANCSKCLLKPGECDNTFLEGICNAKGKVLYSDGTEKCEYKWDSSKNTCNCEDI